MQLCIDVGNSYTKMAIFKSHDIKHFVRSEKITVREIKELEDVFPIEQIIYLATGRENQDVKDYINAYERHIFLNHETKMPIEIMYSTPETLGTDRIASVMGTYSLFPGEAAVVIDMGTCITYDVIDAEGKYLGGNISPGVKMRLDSMHELTEQLPLVEFDDVTNWIGTNTESAIRNGAVLGTLMEVESFLVHAKEELGTFRTILTGGASDFFAKKIKSEIFVDDNLVLRGLNEILLYNDL